MYMYEYEEIKVSPISYTISKHILYMYRMLVRLTSLRIQRKLKDLMRFCIQNRRNSAILASTCRKNVLSSLITATAWEFLEEKPLKTRLQRKSIAVGRASAEQKMRPWHLCTCREEQGSRNTSQRKQDARKMTSRNLDWLQVTRDAEGEMRNCHGCKTWQH